MDFMNFLNKNELIWNLKMLCPISSLSKILRKIETVDIAQKNQPLTYTSL